MSDITTYYLERADDKTAAYRLRYEVFVSECGDSRYTDHDRLIHQDSNDGRSDTILLGARQAGCLVGTVRLTFRATTPLLGDSHYQWQILAQSANLPLEVVLMHVAVADRCAVAATRRRVGVATSLLQKACVVATSHDMRLVVCAVSVSNITASRLVQSIGFLPYGEPCGTDGWIANHYFRLLKPTIDV